MTAPRPALSDGSSRTATRAAGENTWFQAGLLSLIAGYADTLGYLHFDAFAGLMTGNTVLLGVALEAANWTQALRTGLIILAFLSGVGAAALLRRRGVRFAALLVPEAAALVLAAFLPAATAAPVLAFAMGLQNAATTRFAGTTLNTVFLTGDLQKLTQGLVARWRAVDEPSGAPTPPIAVLGVVYVGYFTGVVLGAVAHTMVTRPLLLAALALPLSLLRIGARERARGTQA